MINITAIQLQHIVIFLFDEQDLHDLHNLHDLGMDRDFALHVATTCFIKTQTVKVFLFSNIKINLFYSFMSPLTLKLKKKHVINTIINHKHDRVAT